ncbi:MAG: BTAD domain-containing putative transcriptional regulator [Tissierellales bacterium]
MNSIHVLKSKLIMPELTEGFMLTNRVKELHESLKSCKAVSICAPAGYGKTSLAISYFHYQLNNPYRVCWYRLDPEDNNLSIFINHLLESLFPTEAIKLPESKNSFKEICNKLWSSYDQTDPSPTYVVLDDFQNIAENQVVCNIISNIFDNLPPSYTLFILSRGHINVFTEKQKLEKKVLNIGIDDLAFTNDETKDIILRAGLDYHDDTISKFVTEYTEGWIAGIILICQAFKNRGHTIEIINSDKLIHEDSLFQYMSLEVLKSLEFNIQDALTKLALLQDFTELEASEILGISDVKSVIEQSLKFGMFIHKIPESPAVYRFHSLFRDFMLCILVSSYSEQKIMGLHLKAAQYYISHSIYMRAAEHISKCKNPAAALEIVISAGFNKFLIGEKAQLKIWLDLLPDEVVNLSPILLMYRAQLVPNSRQLEMVAPLQNAIEQSLVDNNLEVYFNLATVLLYILMCNNNMKGLLEMTPDISPKLEYASREMKNTLKILTMVRHIGEEEYSLAKAQSENTLYSLLPEDSQGLYLILSSITYICLGKLNKAQESMEKALIINNFKKVEPAKGFVLLFLATSLCLSNQRECLMSHISEILFIGNKYDYDYLSAGGRRLAAYAKYISLNTNDSIDMLDNSIYHYKQISNKAMTAICKMLRLLWSLRDNNMSRHLDEAKENYNIISNMHSGLLNLEISQSILGAIAREAEDYILAENCLLSSIKTSIEKKGYQVLCGSLFHIAKLYFAKNDTEKGYFYLKQAMNLASDNRYFMFWDIHIQTLVEMILRGVRIGLCTEYAKEVLNKFFCTKAVLYLTEKVKVIDENRINTFASDFISTYRVDDYEQFYFVKASLFGKPEVWINGVKISDADWKTKKVKSFLDYLLLNSGKTISKETLADVLWPLSDSSSAIASQRTALYHLRKVLSRYGVATSGKKALIYETQRGLKIRRNNALDLDIDEFLALYAEFSSFNDVNNSQDEQKRIIIMERIIFLYKGDLMEDFDYGDLIDYERERFKSIFMEVCEKLSLIYIKLREFKQAEEILKSALSADPYDENICLELLKLYNSQKRKSKAIKLYYSFKKRIEEELDIKIDKRLTETIQFTKLQR